MCAPFSELPSNISTMINMHFHGVSWPFRLISNRFARMIRIQPSRKNLIWIRRPSTIRIRTSNTFRSKILPNFKSIERDVQTWSESNFILKTWSESNFILKTRIRDRIQPQHQDLDPKPWLATTCWEGWFEYEYFLMYDNYMVIIRNSCARSSNICYLICLRHLLWLSIVTNRSF